ncbi:hypothetical protein [Iningainema tapete]|uniref:Uncharacterized protein n=1 Tax=Iningainema tapete BLCC-T55 TaxID=2748662 RepID=A0A8J6XKM1_9CYAN|nr:hypothetical protein [Iningainema tapete]MBD2777939.1 hypothetical protein [Iningainema tapete BLCC-T55]
MAKVNEEQYVYTELYETIEISHPESEIRHYLKEELERLISSESEKPISKPKIQTQVPQRSAAVTQQRKSGFRRCSGLSEY